MNISNEKKKAIEIASKFLSHVNPYIGSGMLSNTFDDAATLYQAKQCAVHCIDIVLAKHFDDWDEESKFWLKVKQYVDTLEIRDFKIIHVDFFNKK